MKITLMIDKKKKTFTAPFISGRVLRNTIKLTKEMDLNDLSVEALDSLVDHVCEVYGNQFTQDDFYDGVEANKLLEVVTNCIQEVIGSTNEATKELQDGKK